MSSPNLPPEIWTEIAHHLDLSSLIAYSGSCNWANSITFNLWFWRDKVKRTQRRHLQNDWFLALTHRPHIGLLQLLHVALYFEERWYRIDENAIVLAILHLQQREKRIVELRSVIELLIGRLRMFCRDYDEQTEYCVFYVDGGDLFDPCPSPLHFATKQDHILKHFSEERDAFVRYAAPSSCPLVAQYERERFFSLMKEHFDLAFKDLPSLSTHLIYVMDTSDEGVYNTIDHLLLPWLLEHLPSTFSPSHPLVNELLHYMKSLSEFTSLSFGDLDDPSYLIVDFVSNLVKYSTFDMVSTLLEIARYPRLEHLVRAMDNHGPHVIYYRDSHLYKEVARILNYSLQSMMGGMSCMEPEEWLAWLTTLHLAKEKHDAIVERMITQTKTEGYSYFHSILLSKTTRRASFAQ